MANITVIQGSGIKIDVPGVTIAPPRPHIYQRYVYMRTIDEYIEQIKLNGTDILIMCNATGDLTGNIHEGDVILINDHLGLFLPDSPLKGKEGFLDIMDIYNKDLRDIVKANDRDIKEGVYAYMKGPMYEGLAETRALKMLGGTVVGMSTVPEALLAHYYGMKVLCLSVITAGPLSGREITHEEVCAIAESACPRLNKIISAVAEVTSHAI